MRNLKLFTLIISFTTQMASAQIINFPDENFKFRLLQSATTNFIVGIGWDNSNNSILSYANIDTNNDREIQPSEAAVVTHLNVSGSSISDLTGLEYFTNLRSLAIGGNLLTTFNYPMLTNLIYFSCQFNQIITIDFSSFVYLKGVGCHYNLFTTLDFTNNPLFEFIRCSFNPNLTTLKIKNNHNQLFNDSNSCLFDGNPNLNYICADASEIPILQAFHAANCVDVNPACIINSACALATENFETINLNVFPNPTTNEVFFDNSINQFTSVGVYNTLGQELLSKKLDFLNQENVNLTNFEAGVYLLKFSDGNKTISKTIIKK